MCEQNDVVISLASIEDGGGDGQEDVTVAVDSDPNVALGGVQGGVVLRDGRGGVPLDVQCTAICCM